MKRYVMMIGMALAVAGSALSATVEERLAALEARFEQEVSAREAKLLERIADLEKQVVDLSTQVVSVQPSGSVMDSRVAALEGQLASLEAAQLNNPLNGVELGGYGELHYNNLSGSGGASDKKEIDFHRFVLMIGKEFNDRVRFQSELELEHSLAGDGKPGEVELEQAYVDFDLNETHEPPTFYGVERNSVEKNILPTTWWEAGAGLHGSLSDTLSYAAYLHSGLETSGADNYAVRKGRQKVAKALASDPAATVALNWSVPGVTVGGSLGYQSDVTQSQGDAAHAWLTEAHIDLEKGPFGFRALAAQWTLDGDGPEAVGADRQFGWYVEPSYKVRENLGFFARYSQWDNQAGSSSASGKEQIDFGVNWWPHEQVVLKADYQWQSNENGADQSGVNLGVGYEF
jgi:hypothetical protein